MAQKHIQHIKNNGYDEYTDEVDKTSIIIPNEPSPEDILDGELAINYGDGAERIFLKNDSGEIIGFIPKKMFIDAPIVDESEVNYILMIHEDAIVRYEVKPVFYRFVGSDEGNSVVVIDDVSTTVASNQTIQGTCYDITGFTTNNLKEIYIRGNFTAKLSTSDGSNSTVEKVELIYSDYYDVDFSYMLYGYSALRSLSITGCAITSALHMCHGCGKLADVDFGDIDFSRCTSTWAMFNNCQVLKSVDVSDWDMSSVETMQAMFYYCYALESVDVSKWNTSACTNMYGMFSSCQALKSVDVSGFDTSKVTTMHNMFNQCQSLTTLDVSKWDTSNVTDTHSMFNYCQTLNSLDVSKWDTSNVTDMAYMFEHCIVLTSLDVNNWNTSNVTDMSYMFNYCYGLDSLDISNWDTSKVTTMHCMFTQCQSLTSLIVGDWDIGNVANIGSMFTQCIALRTVDGTINNLMLNIDLSDCPLSRLSALTFMNGFYDYSQGDTHTCTFSDYTQSTLLEEDFTIATAKNWNIGSYERAEDNVGDVVYWNSDQRRMIVINPELVAEDNYPLDLFTPLGILTIPSSHDVYGTGDASMVSLALMDCDNPDDGSVTSATTCGWGYDGLLIDAQEQTCATTGTTNNPTTSLTDVSNISTNKHYLPSDLFDIVQCPTDSKAYYSLSSSDDATPSPYLEDESSNNVYRTITQTTAVGDVNMLSEFDGTGNTAFILDCVTTVGWETADTISDSTSSGNYPAAMCCWRYNPNGTQQGDWYLPAIGELGYLTSRTDTINNSIDIINNAYGTIAHKLESDYTWSSSEYNSSQAIYINFSDGLIYPIEKTNSGSTRAFCHVNLLGYNYYFVGGDADSVVTIDGENITIPVGEEVYGYCSNDITDIPTNNLKEIHTYCDISLRIGSEDEVENYNTTVETVEMAFSGIFERDLTSLCRGLGALKRVTITGSIADSVDYMFNWCENLTDLDVNGINTRRCTNLEDVFSNCRALADIDLSKWDVSQVVDFRGIFYYCPVTSLDITDWDTSKGENFWGVFDTCNKLTYLDLSGWDTGSAKTFRQLFNGCTLLETLVLGDGWDCQGILSDSAGDDGVNDNSFYRMFRNCSALTTVQGSIKNIKANLDLSPCPLTRESALIFINGLSTISGHTLSLSDTTKSYLTDDDIAIATNKGWTIA